MTTLAVEDQISTINALLETSHRLLDEGKTIDLGNLEKMASVLYETIARQPEETPTNGIDALKTALGSMIDELNRLEDRLVQSQAAE